jgi:hypothetical protein
MSKILFTDGTDASFARDLTRVVIPRRSTAPLPAAEPRGAIPGGRGTGLPTGAASGQPDLTEPDAAARTYHAPQEFSTTDGLFTFQLAPIHTVTMEDDSGAEVVLSFAAPVEP